MQFAHSDLTPFAFERTLRSDRPARPDIPAIAPTALADAGAAHRLLRAPGVASEPKLSSLARRWCDAFPAGEQPQALCELYPRLANRMALCWVDKTLATALLRELLIDRRGNRRGFPPAVQAELRLLSAAQGARPDATLAPGRVGSPGA